MTLGRLAARVYPTPSVFAKGPGGQSDAQPVGLWLYGVKIIDTLQYMHMFWVRARRTAPYPRAGAERCGLYSVFEHTGRCAAAGASAVALRACGPSGYGRDDGRFPFRGPAASFARGVSR